MLGYFTKSEDITIRGTSSLLIRSLQDRQQFHDPHGTALRLGISDAIWPLFGLLWPSGLKLAQIMAQQPLRAGQRILELGCGLALPSLVSHRMGADVTASDFHPLAGQFLQENSRLNSLSPLKYRVGHWGAADACARAEDAMAEQTLSPTPYALEPEERALSGRFDLIIGSDLLYERDTDARLPDFIVEHAAPEAQIWIVDPDRSNRAAFSRHMAERGYGVTETRLDCAGCEVTPPYKGRMLIYGRA